MAGVTVVNIWRRKCDHRGEERLISVVLNKETFESFEDKFVCPNSLLEISLSGDEKGPWSKLDDDVLSDLYKAPMGVVFKTFPQTKYIRLQCIPINEDCQQDSTNNAITTGSTPRNAFQVLMDASKSTTNHTVPSKKRSSSGVQEGNLSRKDELFNEITDWMEEKNLTFRNAETEGKYFAQVLTNALWYVTNQHHVINERSRREKSVLGIPPTFDKFKNYNEIRRKKQKLDNLEAEQLKTHSNTLLSLCCKHYMKSSIAWEQAYIEIRNLSESFLSYSTYLGEQNRKVQLNHNLNHPVREVSENTGVLYIAKSIFGVRPEYKVIDKVLALADFNEPILFDEQKHLSSPFQNYRQRLRYFENLQLSVNVDMYKYSPGGSVLTIHCLVKVQENRTESEKCSQIASNLLKIKPKLPEYHTRQMKRNFKEKVNNVAVVQPSLLDAIYKDLTLDASTESHPDTLQRIRMMFMGETGLVPDLRVLNPGRPSGQFDLFFEKMAEVIEEFTAADDRRHNIAHMSEILSIKDLVNQTQERCPENTPVPSLALVRLQFCPRNPYSHTALSFTSKLPVQFKIQRRQLRITHPDDHYCNALFKYERSLAVKLGKSCVLFFTDDKAKVQIGEPDVPMSTGVRGKKSVALACTTLAAADHDLHHKASLTPSVYMRCDIPESIEESFYRGNVTVIVNDSAFQSSNPMRHTAALLKQIQQLEEKPKVVLKYSDGGTDHRTTLEHVKLSAICLFKELDLDMYVAARCAPGHSWINPAERVMSILNIGLQNCALSRQKGTEEFEKKLSRCTSQESIRAMKQEIWEEWEASLEPVKRTVENRFRRLALKDKPFQVMDVITDNEMDHLSRHIDLLFPNMDKNKLVKSHTSRIEEYVKWLDLHCRQRHYSFQIRKCDQPECCSPVTTRCSWLPDPVLDDTGNHYKSFEDVYTTNTTEEDRPTLTRRAETITAKKKVPNKGSRTDPIINIVPEDINLRGEASLFTGQNARYTVTCNECEKPRIIYSKSKLTERQKVQLALLMSEYEYTCGSPLTPPDHSLHGKLLTKLNIECKNPVETAYYSSSIDRPDICYYCGASEAPTDMELKKQFKTVFPLCDTCRNKGFKVATLRPYGKHK